MAAAKIRKGTTIAVVNNKGGVGKTTTAVNLAAVFGMAGARVLLIDLDPQASASFSLGITREKQTVGSYGVLLNNVSIKKAIQPTQTRSVDILAGSLSLLSADLDLAPVRGREVVLKKALAHVTGSYDAIIIDCPPSIGLLTINALTSAGSYIAPMTADYLALEGFSNLLTAVEMLRKGIGQSARLLGILLTMVDYRQKVTAQVSEMVRTQFGEQVFKTEIRINVRLREAPSFGQSIIDYDNLATGADGYRSLAQEVLDRINNYIIQ